MSSIGHMFENLLLKSRLLVLVTIFANIVMSIGMFYVATLDTFSMVKLIAVYTTAADGSARLAVREEVVAYLIKAIDGYLIAIIVLVLGLGLYELFITKISSTEAHGFSRDVLKIRSLDDLKQRLARLILLILMVEYFRAVMEVRYTSPVELLYLALGIALIGATIYLSSPREGQQK
ncbi:MAG: YqhA family protein [Syntrophobacteraceae bacterium]